MDARSISKELIEKAVDPDLATIGVEIADVGLDNLLDENILKEIPVIKTIYALGRFGNAVREKLFVAKIAKFLLFPI